MRSCGERTNLPREREVGLEANGAEGGAKEKRTKGKADAPPTRAASLHAQRGPAA